MKQTYNDWLAAVADAPQDLDLRLVFADWLEEHDEGERAEFIRVGIQAEENLSCDQFMYSCGELLDTLEKLAAEGCRRCSRRAYLLLREKQLLHENALRWCSRERVALTNQVVVHAPRVEVHWALHMDEFYSSGCIEVMFRRGFVEEVSCTMEQWHHYGPLVVCSQPILRVCITDWQPWPTHFVRPHPGDGSVTQHTTWHMRSASGLLQWHSQEGRLCTEQEVVRAFSRTLLRMARREPQRLAAFLYDPVG
jgi:uncharacterized protein (TIGR02996 family)